MICRLLCCSPSWACSGLRSMIKRSLAVSLCLVGELAMAAAPVATGWIGDRNKVYASASAACDSNKNDNNTVAITGYNSDNTVAFCTTTRKGDNYKDVVSIPAVMGCASGATPNYGLPVSKQCPDVDAPCVAGTPGVWKWEMPADESKRVPIHGASDGHCEVDVVGVQECRERKDGSMYCIYDTKMTGNSKNPGPEGVPTSGAGAGTPTDTRKPVPPISNPPNSNCPAGTVQGGSDSSGIPICIGMGSNPQNQTPKPPTTTSPSVKVTNSDGSTTTTTTTTVTNSDGSTTTVKDIVTVGASGATTTTQTRDTSTTPTAKPGKDDSASDESKKDLCTRNPTLTVCNNSSVSGTCEAISCTGDAIQCATLRATATMECRDKQDRADLNASPLMALGKQAVSGNDPMAGSFPSPGKASVVNAPSSLDTPSFISSSSYFKDKTFVVQGKTITLPLSKGADMMIAFRYALMLVAALVSFNIVRSAVLT